jgi:predicted enzyme related to lactoylglutathione lyase
MSEPLANPVVHLELRTANLSRVCAFYTRLFGWTVEDLRLGSRSYLALDLGERIQGGVVEGESDQPTWLPYVEVADIFEAADRADVLGASVLVEPREGPAGWRSLIGAPAGGMLGLWQPK